MIPAGVQLDHHRVFQSFADHHVHVKQRELPYSTVKLLKGVKINDIRLYNEMGGILKKKLYLLQLLLADWVGGADHWVAGGVVAAPLQFVLIRGGLVGGMVGQGGQQNGNQSKVYLALDPKQEINDTFSSILDHQCQPVQTICSKEQCDRKKRLFWL